MKIVLILTLLFTLPLLAQEEAEEEKHPIEIELEKALKKDYSTAGMVQAFGKAHTQWDAELNKNYKILIKGLDAEAQKALREAQRAWVAQRDKEIEYLIAFYSKMSGTMYRVIYAETTMTMVKRRAVALGHMVEMLELRDK